MAEAPKKHRPTDKNLKHDFTHEQRAANGAKGGVASGEARRKNRTMRAVLQSILDCNVPEEEARQRLEALGLDGTIRDDVSMAMIERARRGDVEAGRFVRDTIGEKPREGVDIGLEDKPIASLDLSKLTDDQLRMLAGRAE